MFFALKSDCYFRTYGSIGYITIPVISKEEVVDSIGAKFIEQLNYQPQEIDSLVAKLADCFDNVELTELKDDAIEFYLNLAEDGFLNVSDKLADFKDKGFDYSSMDEKNEMPVARAQLEEPSSYFLSDYFKENPYLETFHIELTSKCNERCVHCYIPHEKKTTDIDYDLMIDTLKQCKDMNVMTVIFSGGEPMMHPYFCDFVRYAKDLDFNVTVLSNLTLLNDDIIEALKYKHVACVNVSLYSMDAKTHDSITNVKGSFEKTKNNILRLIDNNVAVQINCPIMKQNKDDFQNVVRWGQGHKCSVVTDYLIMARFDHTIDNLNNRLTEDDLKTVLKNLVESDVTIQANIKENETDSESDLYIGNPEDRVCGVGMSTLCMVANGDVYPCAGWQQYICGNIKYQTLKDIWNTSPSVLRLRNLRLKDFDKCVNCQYFKYCVMCLSRNSNEAPDGDIFNIPQITCEAAQIYKNIVDAYKDGCNDNPL